MCLVTTFIYIVVPIHALVSIVKDFNLVKKQEFLEKFGALYEGIAV